MTENKIANIINVPSSLLRLRIIKKRSITKYNNFLSYCSFVIEIL